MDYKELVYDLQRTHFFEWGFNIIESHECPDRGVIFNESIQVYFHFDDVVDVVDMDFYIVIGFTRTYALSVSKEGTIINI